MKNVKVTAMAGRYARAAHRCNRIVYESTDCLTVEAAIVRRDYYRRLSEAAYLSVSGGAPQ